MALPDRPSRPVTTATWQEPDLIRWSFSHVEQILPTAVIPAGTQPAELPAEGRDLLEVTVTGPAGESLTVAEVVAATDTDAWLVWHRGRLVAEHHLAASSTSRHLLQSVSKSLVGTVVATLVDRGVVDPAQPVSAYVPELIGTGYADATVRQLLDMRSGVGFDEDYTNPLSDSRRLEAVTGWAPLPPGTAPGTLRSFLAGLRQIRPHGGPFDYRSSETDVLGLVCQAAAGRPFPALAGELLWSPIGAANDAAICVDQEGTGVFDGGICATPRDLIRFGAMIIADGFSLTGRRVVSDSWIEDVYAGAPDGTAAFAASAAINGMPGGRYRSQFWCPSPRRDLALALGIHGQLIYLDRGRDLVGVKLSSWPTAQDFWKHTVSLAMFDAIAAELSA